MLVVFNDTAATEIETYGHPLSLHDALPICTDSTTAAVGRGRRRVLTAPDSHAGTLLEVDDLRTSFVTPRGVVTAVDGVSLSLERRSEEHTSELQSLMRISYAVFCLKKTKHTKLKQTATELI